MIAERIKYQVKEKNIVDMEGSYSAIYDHLIRTGEKNERYEKCSKEVRMLIAKMTCITQTERLSAGQVLETLQTTVDDLANVMEQDIRATLTENYTVDKLYLIEQGEFGRVYQGKDRHGKNIAVKIVEYQSEYMLKLIDAHRSGKNLDHKNIVKVMDVYALGRVNDKNLWIFMEYCRGGDLLSFFSRNNDLTITTCLHILCQIAEAIGYLHGQNFVHRDVKPSNVLVYENSDFTHIKLADFDCLKSLTSKDEIMTDDIGTPQYKAPEFFLQDENGEIHYTSSVDVFASGLTFLAILQGFTSSRWLTPRLEETAVEHRIISIGQEVAHRKGIRVVKMAPSWFSSKYYDGPFNEAEKNHDITTKIKRKELRELIDRMTKRIPGCRPSAEEVVRKLNKIANL